ncbi:hypothetical protein JCM10908_001614 [Rhodotorula pacifica]|uniref:uncharacterized protein n=1 Tax=Rhodotorula pacifica TaxID=1495444 RepID=UPI0031756149
MATPTYNDGLYHPWQPTSADAGTDWAAPATSSAAAAWEAATTSTADATWSAVATSSSSSAGTTTAAWTTTSAWVAPSSSTTSTAAWTSSSTSSTSSTTTTTRVPTTATTRASTTSLMTSPPAASSASPSTTSSSLLSSSIAAASSLAATTVSRYSNPSGTAISAIAASGEKGGSSSFKLVYLIPAFVIVPLVAIFAILACTYGRCWGRGREKTPLPGSNAGSSAWWGGAVGSWRRGMHDPDGDDEEMGGLVREKSRAPPGASAYEYDEKRFSLPSNRGGSRWTSVFSIASRSALPYQQEPVHEASIPFLSVSQAPVDQPFVPPSRSSSTHDFPRWTAQDPYGPSRAPVNNGFLSAGVWRMGSQSRRYNPRMTSVPEGANLQRGISTRSTDSFGSRLSDKIFKRFSPGTKAIDACPSPSVYSPSPENAGPQSFGAAGTYMGLQGVDEDDDEDDFIDEKKHADLDYDAFLAEARVRDGGLAKRYAAGEVTEVDLPPRQAASTGHELYNQNDARQRYLARHGNAPSDPFARPSTPPFDVDLPSAPSRLQVSPKKTASTLVRAAAPETPERDGARNLLFSYASPPVNPGSPRPPLPPVPNQNGATRATSPTKAPLTDAPTRSAFRQQAAPQLAKPVRPNDPFAPVAVPASRKSVDADRPLSVGSPMPAYEPPTVRQSELSAFSLDAYGALAYSDAEEAHAEEPTKRQSRSKHHSMSAKQAASRQAEQHEVGSTAGAVKARPKSAYAQLPSQTSTTSAPRLPARTDLRPVSRSKSAKVEGFDPVFPDSPDLKPLQHPNRVRAAVENLESSRAQIKAQHRKTESHDSSRSASNLNSSLSRSATAGPSVGYRRPLGNKGLDSDEDGNSSDDSEAIKINRRLSRLILNRSKSQTQIAPSPDPSVLGYTVDE